MISSKNDDDKSSENFPGLVPWPSICHPSIILFGLIMDQFDPLGSGQSDQHQWFLPGKLVGQLQRPESEPLGHPTHGQG